jgi:type IV pilus assembly protein PilC
MKSSDADKHQFYAEMAKLLEAGFGIREAAGVMTGTGLPAAQARLLEEMHQGLTDGKSIAEALGGNPEMVSDIERGIITAGERGGRLATAMRHLADYYGMLASTRREVIKSLIHPIIVLHLGVFVGTVPMAMLGGEKSMTRIASGFFPTLLLAYAAAFAAFIGIRALLRAARENAGIDRMLRRIPLLGKTRNNLAMAGFCKVYHTCLLAGIPMRETVRSSAGASRSGMIRDAANRLDKALAGGNPLGPAMLAEPAFPNSFARSYATGEAAGTLDTDLANWSKLFQTDAEAGSKTLATVVPKALYFLVLCYVGWTIVGFYGGYYDTILKELE